jgi:hypothetical protein
MLALRMALPRSRAKSDKSRLSPGNWILGRRSVNAEISRRIKVPLKSATVCRNKLTTHGAGTLSRYPLDDTDGATGNPFWSAWPDFQVSPAFPVIFFSIMLFSEFATPIPHPV